MKVKLEDLFDVDEDTDSLRLILNPKKHKTKRLNIVTELGIITIYPARTYGKLSPQWIHLRSTAFDKKKNRHPLTLDALDDREGMHITFGYDKTMILQDPYTGELIHQGE